MTTQTHQFQAIIDELKEQMPSETYRLLCEKTKKEFENEDLQKMLEAGCGYEKYLITYTHQRLVAYHPYECCAIDDDGDCCECACGDTDFNHRFQTDYKKKVVFGPKLSESEVLHIHLKYCGDTFNGLDDVHRIRVSDKGSVEMSVEFQDGNTNYIKPNPSGEDLSIGRVGLKSFIKYADCIFTGFYRMPIYGMRPSYGIGNVRIGERIIESD